MNRSEAVRVAVAASGYVHEATDEEITDWLTHLDPDVVVLTGETYTTLSTNGIPESESDREVYTLRDYGGNHTEVSGTELSVLSASSEAVDAPGAGSADFLVSDALELDVDTNRLETRLEGTERYGSFVPDGAVGGAVHLSTRIPHGYHRVWGDLEVVGAGRRPGVEDPLVAFDLSSDGDYDTETLNPDRLGLKALDGVGEKRSRTLREHGYGTREDAHEADVSELADLPGMNRTTAERIEGSARAVQDGEVVRRTDEPLPSGDPVFIDIETDGLNPTVVWLVGVLDPGKDTYMSFLQKDPSEPAAAVRDFVSWYTANADSRPVVAYNGWGFDFPVVREQLVEHHPDLEDAWTSAYRFDPYRWAVEDGNAYLPGLTNRLEDVASALGYDRSGTGLSGAKVADNYRRWMEDPTPGAEHEPDWGLHKRYCEEDVRALGHVYREIRETSRILSETETEGSQTETRQGSLSEW